jgi:hypothetical protein
MVRLVLHRWFSGRAFLALSLLGAAACAQPGHNFVGGGGGDSGHGGGDGGMMGGGEPDLADVDLAGVDFSGVDFATAPDMAGVCDVLKQTGCGANEKCSLGAMNAPSCFSDGDKANGALCGAGSADDCVHGELCITEGTNLNQCRQFCAADSDCKQPAQPGGATNVPHCLITLDMTSAKVCTVACNPVTAAAQPRAARPGSAASCSACPRPATWAPPALRKPPIAASSARAATAPTAPPTATATAAPATPA